MLAGQDPRYSSQRQAMAKALREKAMNEQVIDPRQGFLNMLAAGLAGRSEREQEDLKNTEDSAFYKAVLGAKPLPWQNLTQPETMAQAAAIEAENNPRFADTAAKLGIDAMMKAPDIREKEMKNKIISQLLGGEGSPAGTNPAGTNKDALTALALVDPAAANAIANTNPQMVGDRERAKEKAKADIDLEKQQAEDSKTYQRFNTVVDEALKTMMPIDPAKFGPIGGKIASVTGDEDKQVLASKLNDLVGQIRILSKYPASGFSDSDALRLERIVGGSEGIQKNALGRILRDFKTRFDAFQKGGVPQSQSSNGLDMSKAKQGNDGKMYIPDPNRPGKYLMVE